MDVSLAFLFLFLVLIVLVLVSPGFLSRFRRAEEKGLTPLYEEWCAVHRNTGRLGSAGRNMFLWRVAFYPKFMVFALFSQDLIPYEQVAGVELKNFQDSKEVWLRRHLDGGTELITIKSRHAERIVDVLASTRASSAAVQARSNVRL